MTYKFRQSPSGKPKYDFGDQRVPYDSEHPRFSFRYFHEEHPKYSAKAITDLKDWAFVVRGLKQVSGLTWREIKQARQFRAHEVTWSDTAERAGFKHLAPEFQRFPAFQFKAFDICRVFGFFDQINVFQIVWLDRNHAIYPER